MFTAISKGLNGIKKYFTTANSQNKESYLNLNEETIAKQMNQAKELAEKTGVKSEEATEDWINIEVKGSPFRVVGNKEKGYWLATGNYKITEPTKTKNETWLKLQDEKWNIIVSLTWMLLDVKEKMQIAQKESNALRKK